MRWSSFKIIIALLPRPFRGEGRGEGKVESMRDPHQHPFQILADLSIGKPNNAIATLYEELRSPFVVTHGVGMTIAVDFHGEQRGKPAGEIDDVRSHDLLTAKFCAAKPAGS